MAKSTTFLDPLLHYIDSQVHETPRRGAMIASSGTPTDPLQEIQSLYRELGSELESLRLELTLTGQAVADWSGSEASPGRSVCLIHSLRNAVQSVRRISAEMKTTSYASIGLCDTIRWQMREFNEMSGIDWTLHALGEIGPVDGPTTAHIVKIMQLILASVINYGESGLVVVRLSSCENGEIECRVQDDGGGITDRSVSECQSLTLHLLNERIKRAGGSISVSDVPGMGTMYSFTVPSTKGRCH